MTTTDATFLRTQPPGNRLGKCVVYVQGRGMAKQEEHKGHVQVWAEVIDSNPVVWFFFSINITVITSNVLKIPTLSSPATYAMKPPNEKYGHLLCITY